MEEHEIEVFDLELEEDQGKLEEQLTTVSKYFSPVSNKKYKVELTSTKVTPIVKEFDDKEITKYQFEITAKTKEGETFTGVWEVGKKVAKDIFDSYTKDRNTQFDVYKTGSGLDTRYSVTPQDDF